MHIGGKLTKFRATSFMIDGHGPVKCISPMQYSEHIQKYLRSRAQKAAVLQFSPRPTDEPVKNLVYLISTFQHGNLEFSKRVLYSTLVLLYD
jgi:hypothetical protein